MKMKLFGTVNRKSFNTLKLRFALAEAGADYQFVPVDLAKGEQKTAEFLALNPHGKVPVLRDGNFALPESDAILWYIAEKFPDAKLLPAAGAGPSAAQSRARVLQWCAFASTALYPAYADFWTYALGAPDKRLPWAAELAQQKLTRNLDLLEAVLGGRQYLAGPDAGNLSIADLSNASMVNTLKLKMPSDPFTGRPQLSAWFQRVTSRPAWARALDDAA